MFFMVCSGAIMRSALFFHGAYLTEDDRQRFCIFFLVRNSFHLTVINKCIDAVELVVSHV